jgi:hypothetical protein
LSSISLVVLLVPFRVSAAVPSPVLRADSWAIDVQSWPGSKRGASDSIWDIGHVPLRNFD